MVHQDDCEELCARRRRHTLKAVFYQFLAENCVRVVVRVFPK
jgi:hypothetical protein